MLWLGQFQFNTPPSSPFLLWVGANNMESASFTQETNNHSVCVDSYVMHNEHVYHLFNGNVQQDDGAFLDTKLKLDIS